MDTLPMLVSSAPRPRLEPPTVSELASTTARILGGVRIAAWRMGLASSARDVSLPILRGAFGAALHDLSSIAYEEVFRAEEQDAAPAYLLRRSGHRLPDRALFEMVLFERALPHLDVVLTAMQLAGERGLGRDRRPFVVERLAWLDALGRPAQALAREEAFALDRCSWPLAGNPATTPCRLLFPEPVRILRTGVLQEQLTLRDIAVAGFRRLGGLAQPEHRPLARALQETGLDAADGTASQTFVGSAGSVGRWSATQQQFIELRGVTGHIDLPDGPGGLWRLLTALQWIHCGKATVVGLGRLVVLPIW
jgi:hypothetical protein